jgi:hypothetical protein
MPRLDPEGPQRTQLEPSLVTRTEIKEMGERVRALGRPVEARSQLGQLPRGRGEVRQAPAVTADQGAQLPALAGARLPTMSEAGAAGSMSEAGPAGSSGPAPRR